MADLCEKPDLELIIGELPNPLCDDPIFVNACVVDAQFPDYPEVDSPPRELCTCINDGEDVTTNQDPYDGDPESPTYNPNGPEYEIGDHPMTDYNIDVTMVLLNEDCCDPEYEFKITSVLPCMPTYMAVDEGFSNDGTVSLTMDKITERYDEEDPPNIIEDNLCEYEVTLRVPEQARLEVNIVHEGNGIRYVRDCDTPSVQGGIELDGVWQWNDLLQVRRLTLIVKVDFVIPMIGRLEDVKTSGDPLYVYDSISLPAANLITGSTTKNGSSDTYLGPRPTDDLDPNPPNYDPYPPGA